MLVALAALAAGCGGDGDGPAGDTERASSPAPQTAAAAPAEPDREAADRSLAAAARRCAQTRGVPPGAGPRGRARRGLKVAPQRLRALSRVTPTSERRESIAVLSAGYQTLLPLYQQVAVAPPGDAVPEFRQAVSALRDAERSTQNAAIAAGLPACAPVAPG